MFLSTFFIGRDEKHLKYVKSYLEAVHMYRDYNNPDQDPVFSEVI